MNLPRGYTYTWPGWRRQLLALVMIGPVLALIGLQWSVEWLHWNVSNRAVNALDRVGNRLVAWLERHLV